MLHLAQPELKEVIGIDLEHRTLSGPPFTFNFNGP